ncbi:MAG: GNAT family N-acetyltransferase [Bacteroidales bacterium]|nr:GNAT family N-acetyltransferase [Bacteroidales bacterium]
MKNFLIRDFSSSDFSAITKIWLACDLGNPARGDNLEVIERTISMGGRFFVLEHQSDNKIIACSWITNDGRRLYLHHFGVLPEYRNNGYAKELLNYSLDFAKKSGLQIKLEVHKDNIEATSLYEKAGFKYLGDYKVFIIRDYSQIY